MTPDDTFEEIKLFLPRYLSDDAGSDLFGALSQFPNNVDARMYTSALASTESYYQGDGVAEMPFVDLPNTEIRPLPALILSNTCDIDPSNTRLVPMRVMYAPIFRLEKFEGALRAANPGAAIGVSSYVDSIRRQRVSNILYLPPGMQGLRHEGFGPLDRIQNAPASGLHNNPVSDARLFSLSNYGFYMLLFKLSIHFSRIREKVQRE
jgi:hypothetical protein